MTHLTSYSSDAHCVNKSCFSTEAVSWSILYYDLPVTVSGVVADTTTTYPSWWCWVRPLTCVCNAGACEDWCWWTSSSKTPTQTTLTHLSNNTQATTYFEPQACTCHLILIVLLAHILLPYHKYRLYKYKAPFCNQHATLPEANEDNKAHVLCVHFYQTAVSNELHSFELSARYVVFS